MSHSHSDFELPGLASRGLASWIVAISFAYSGQWNSRRLENHFYAFWNLVLLDLVSDLAPETLVIPQFQLDTLDDEPLALDDSIITTSQPNAKVLTPDFAIAVFHLIRRPATLPALPMVFPIKFNSWRDVRVEKMKVPLIAELKRPPTRAAKSRRVFREAVLTGMTTAYADLLKQAEHAFIMQPGVKEIALVACCGEWWSWMIATRAKQIEKFSLAQTLDPLAQTLDSDSESEDEDDPISQDIPLPGTRKKLHRRVKNSTAGRHRDESPPPPSDSEKIPYKPRTRGSRASYDEGEQEEEGNADTIFVRYVELGEGAMESVTPNVEDAMPVDDEWSLPILFGSEASAQHFFLIHRFLEVESQELLAEDQVIYILVPQKLYSHGWLNFQEDDISD
jgi:hypothetical protein